MLKAIARTLLFSSICFILVGTTDAAVTGWDFLKGVRGVQGADNVSASKLFFVVDGAGDATSITLTGASISGSIAYVRTGTEWFFQKTYASEAAMDAEFPSGGVFTITLSGGTLVQSVAFGPQAYPSFPVLSGTTFSDLQSMDSSSGFQMTFAQPGSGVTAAEIVITETASGNSILDEDLSASATTYTIPL